MATTGLFFRPWEHVSKLDSISREHKVPDRLPPLTQNLSLQPLSVSIPVIRQNVLPHISPVSPPTTAPYSFIRRCSSSSSADSYQDDHYISRSQSVSIPRSPFSRFVPQYRSYPPLASRCSRPAELQTMLSRSYSSSDGNLCPFCSKRFKREKSLQIHIRIHTRERPFVCDYPSCDRKFAQSGQLRTHHRLHTQEKPYRCDAADCGRRFTHSNRRCADHPNKFLVKDASEFKLEDANKLASMVSSEEHAWLVKYAITLNSKQRSHRRLPSNSLQSTAAEIDSALALIKLSSTGHSPLNEESE